MCHWATLLLLSSSFFSSQKSTLDNQITFLTCSRGNKYIVCTWMSDSSMQKWKPVTLSLLQLYPSTHRLMVAKHPGLTIPIMSKMKCTTYRGAVFNTVSLFACNYTVQGEGFERGGGEFDTHILPNREFGQQPPCLVLCWKSWVLLNPVRCRISSPHPRLYHPQELWFSPCLWGCFQLHCRAAR